MPYFPIKYCKPVLFVVFTLLQCHIFIFYIYYNLYCCTVPYIFPTRPSPHLLTWNVYKTVFFCLFSFLLCPHRFYFFLFLFFFLYFFSTFFFLENNALVFLIVYKVSYNWNTFLDLYPTSSYLFPTLTPPFVNIFYIDKHQHCFVFIHRVTDTNNTPMTGVKYPFPTFTPLYLTPFFLQTHFLPCVGIYINKNTTYIKCFFVSKYEAGLSFIYIL